MRARAPGDAQKHKLQQELMAEDGANMPEPVEQSAYENGKDERKMNEAGKS